MGEIREDDEGRAAEVAEVFAQRAQHYAELGRPDLAERLGAAGRYPERLTGAPVVLDTDVGGDPDDALALAVAALTVPQLALVVTCDEHAGERARFARHLLDLCGRPDVPVVAGSTTSAPGPIVVRHLIPDTVPTQPTDLAAAADVCRREPGTVRWVGLGPMTNLAALLTRYPDLVHRLDVTLMAGAINYRDPERAEHNVRLDVAAARTVLGTVRRPTLVMSDVTFTPQTEITADHPVYRRLADPCAPAWARLLREHLDAWFARHHPGTMQHDPLTLATALQLPFVDLGLERVGMDDLGRMSLRDNGFELFVSYAARYPAFNAWLERQLSGGEAEPERVRFTPEEVAAVIAERHRQEEEEARRLFGDRKPFAVPECDQGA